MKRAVLAGILSVVLAACGGDGDPVPGPAFPELRADYDALEGRIFPGSRTDPQKLALIDRSYAGTAVFAYYEDGGTFTETAAARFRLSFGASLTLLIGGEVSGFALESARPIAGQLFVRDGSLSGNDIEGTLSGELMIGGETLAVEGRFDGAFYTSRGSSDEGAFAYGNISLTAGPDSHRFGGTFALERLASGS